MVFVNPEHGAGYQEALHLVAAIVKLAGSPLGMLPLLDVLIFIAEVPVKFIQPVSVLGEVGGNPVHNHANALLVHDVHKLHKILRPAVPGGGGKVSAALIAPGAVKGVFCNGQQLHMGVAHI